MTDTQVAETNETTTESTPAPKPPKAVVTPHVCYCQTYELYDPKDDDSVFTTGCEQTTKSTFAQGHDARLVSMLVDGYFDGYQIRQALPGEGEGSSTATHSTPADAVAHISEKLAEKANKATLHRRAALKGAEERKAAREALKVKRAEDAAKLKAEKAAAKEAEKAEKAAANPKASGKNTGEVVADSVEGDRAPLADGQVRIKVGRWEYTAVIDDEGNATYADGAGVEQVTERDGYRLLEV